jgi:hypothetical protein
VVERGAALGVQREMVLMETVAADTTTLPGFEHRTFLCSACHDIERRLMFTGAKTPTATSRPDLPPAKLRIGRGTAPRRAWGSAVEKFLSRQKAVPADKPLEPPPTSLVK